MKLITEIKLKYSHTKQDLLKSICKKAKISEKDIKNYEIIKFGIDARKKPDILFVYNVAIDVEKSLLNKLKNFEDITPDHSGLDYAKSKKDIKPVVVGFGPSGMFCALALALAGLNPIVLEQGKSVEERMQDVENFWQNGILNEHSNVQFGEGGAGTFSDGKLNTTLNNPYCKKVINEFILNGAPNEIYYKNKAHIGTDNLRKIVKNIREKIQKNGGKIIFNAKMTNFDIKNAQINSVEYVDIISNKTIKLNTNCLILAIGHSAFSTFKMLKNNNVKMVKKPFAMGVRIEHPQKIINKAQYGIENDSNLPSADYKLVEHLKNGRSVFTFCMCPGGKVVASSSEQNTIVTNGMSNFARNEKNANSAVLVNVTPNDFEGDDVLQGFYLQQKSEKLAFEIAGKNYNAPAITVGEFLLGKKFEHIETSYKPNITICDVSKIFPNFVVESLKMALPLFDKKIKGFANGSNLLIAPETRSSCPVQMVREVNYECSFKGLYVCGEGAGFAGGIVSSAVDGIKCAENILK